MLLDKLSNLLIFSLIWNIFFPENIYFRKHTLFFYYIIRRFILDFRIISIHYLQYFEFKYLKKYYVRLIPNPLNL